MTGEELWEMMREAVVTTVDRLHGGGGADGVADGVIVVISGGGATSVLSTYAKPGDGEVDTEELMLRLAMALRQVRRDSGGRPFSDEEVERLARS